MSVYSSPEWYSAWFDTSYYHSLYKNRDFKEAEAFIDNLFEKFEIHPGERCLDLACGKGRHTRFLHMKGMNATGLDLSVASIQSAKKFETDGLDFHVHDMREVWKSNEFQYILNLFTSFGYFEKDNDNQRVLDAVYEMLKTGGFFLFDYMNAAKVSKTLVPNEIKVEDGITFNIKRYIQGGFIVKEISFEADNQFFKFYEKVKVLTYQTFKKMFEVAGFKIIAIFGDYQLTPFSVVKSDRLIIIAQKYA